MNRYLYTNIFKDSKTGKRAYRTTLYPTIYESSTDIFIISRVGDRLDNLAFEYYGDATKWFIIANANYLGKGTLSIPPGTTVRIPLSTSKFERDLEILQED
jgi:hypothetical protein